jgi:cytochrome b6-f complex iron-sulfur subunit
MSSVHEETGRRRFFARLVTSIHLAIGGTLGVLLGGAAVSSAFGSRQQSWLPASSLGDLPPGVPTPVVVGVTRRDGYTQVIDQRTIFLVRTGAQEVTALDSTCTHLGCRVSWDRNREELRCPCHGGVYHPTGAVKAGPPPAPLARIATRVDAGQVLVQL